jgi:hypothetical protein
VFIQFHNGEKAVINDSLFSTLSEYCWHTSTTGYVVNRMVREDGEKTTIRMHRLVWELVNGPIPEGMDVDHINNDRLDNRIENLRLATRSQNLANTPDRYENQHGYRGVARRRSGKYRGYVWKDSKQHWTQTVDTPEEAAQLRDELALELHGEFAVLNF